MKKTKVIIPALGILLLSTAASVTGTVAWFTASNTVKVSGMNIQAQAEQGIVIANESKSNYSTAVEASHNGKVTVEGSEKVQALRSTSTSDFVNWFHGYSDSASLGQSNVVYEALIVSKPAASTGNGFGTATLVNENSASNIYLLNRFYIQSASKVAIQDQDIYLKDLKAETTTNSALLDASLRVGVKFGEEINIFAPVASASDSYAVVATINAETKKAETTTNVQAITDTSGTAAIVATNQDIPAYTDDGGLEFEVYIWFEGEDKNHNSNNIVENLDELAVSFVFGNKATTVQP